MAPNKKRNSDLRKDPLPVFCFHVFIEDLNDVAFFKSVSGLKYEMDTVQYREGGQNATTYQLFNGTKWSNVTLKQGYCKGSKMLEWRNAWLNPLSAPRRNVTITILDTSLTGQQGWQLHNCMPVKWEISEFDASKSELAIETIELAHEGITLTDGSLADLE